jgi:glycosyltransferase involved in cell wall biosynthesis
MTSSQRSSRETAPAVPAPLRVLFISSFLLFPESRVGGAKRLFYLAQELSRSCDLSVLCTDVSGEAAGNNEPVKTPFRRFFHLRYQRHLLDKLGSPLGVERSLRAHEPAINDFLGVEPYDAVICAFPHTLSFLSLPRLQSARVIYIEDDLSLETARARIAATRSLWMKWALKLRLVQSTRFYARMMRRVSTFVSISREEEAIMQKRYPVLATRLVGYGIPIDDYVLVGAPPAGLVLGFIGHYGHQSNVDAIEHFLDAWYPALKMRYPGLSVHIAGKEIPARFIEKYRSDRAIVWLENVLELRRFYEEISIFVNPIVSQRGLRTKLVESAAFGRPIISTALGAEGLADLDIRIAESAAECAEACAALASPEIYQESVRRNRRVVEESYSIEAIGRSLFDCVSAVAHLQIVANPE